MKFKIKLSIALVMSLMVVACGGGGSGGDPVKMAKVWRMVKEVQGDDSFTNLYDNNGVLYKREYPIEDDGIDYFEYYEAFTYKNGVIFTIEGFRRLDPLVDFERFSIVTMDEQGNAESYDSLTILDHAFLNTYNDDGSLLIKREIDSSLNGIGVDEVRNYAYDGNTVEVIMTNLANTPTIINKVKYTYDDNGNLISSTWHDPDTDALTYQKTYVYYDDNGDGNADRQVSVDGSVERTKNFEWKEVEIPEKNAKKEQKGCLVKPGGCIDNKTSGTRVLPTMFYSQ